MTATNEGRREVAQAPTEFSVSIDGKPHDRWLTQKALCAFLDVSERTLERMRADGNGPRFSKAGKRVLYRSSDVESWLAERSFASTAEAKLAAER
jgi:predicted DNA-binding transcriptional regulator AlpA